VLEGGPGKGVSYIDVDLNGNVLIQEDETAFDVMTAENRDAGIWSITLPLTKSTLSLSLTQPVHSLTTLKNLGNGKHLSLKSSLMPGPVRALICLMFRSHHEDPRF